MSDKEETDLKIDSTEIDPSEEALAAPKYEIFSYPADTTLKGYKEQWDKGQLVVPDFQREYIWDQVRASKLIESFLLGLPVPPVFLYRSADKKAFLVVDGQQRIRSAVDFQKGLFGEKKFRLKGVDEKWDGKTFAELDDADQFQLENAVLRAIVIQQTNPKDQASIFHIFERLNTGGVRLNPMEVRNCVSYSNFLKDIRKTNTNEAWRKIIGLDLPDKRFKDVELVLRVLALADKYENYEKPMKGFLNNYTAAMAETTAEKYLPALKDFAASAEFVLANLGEKPFHLRGRLNFSLLDAVLVSVMRNKKPKDFKKKFESLLQDPDFEASFTYNTSDESVLKFRIAKALKSLA